METPPAKTTTKTRSRNMAADGGLIFDREATLDVLFQSFERASHSKSLQIVTLAADAGFGKTRVLLEFEARIRTTDGPPARVAYGRALAANSVGNGFEPLREALADLLSEEATRGNDKLRTLARAFKDNAPDWLDALPVVGSVLHAAALTVQSSRSDAPVIDSMTAQFLALVRQLTAEQPLVLLLDDLHWADQSTVDLIFSLTQRFQGEPLLLVLAYRNLDTRYKEHQHPLRQAIWRVERYATVIEAPMPLLSPDSITRLVAATLGEVPASPVVDWIERYSEGNPLFVHEFLWHLTDLRARTGEPVDLLVDRAHLQALPRTLEAILADRLESLDYEEVRVLQLAAIIGPLFTPDEVVALSDLGLEPTMRALRCLCQRMGLIRAAPSGNSYTFFHGLVREYILLRLKAEDIVDYRRIHSAWAEYLARQVDEKHEWLEEVAFHYHEAGRHAEALHSCLRVGESLRMKGAISEAARFFEWALEHADALPSREDSFRCRWRLAQVRQELIHTNEAIRLLRQAGEWSSGGSISPGERARYALDLAKAYRMEEYWDDARAQLAELRQNKESLDKESQALLHVVEAEVAMCGEPVDRGLAEDALVKAKALSDDAALLASIYGHLGFLALARDDLSGSRYLIDLARRTSLQAPNPGRQYETLLWSAKWYLACLQLDDAQRDLDDMVSLCERLGVGLAVAHHCRDTGRRAALSGDLDGSIAAYEKYASHMLLDDSWTVRAVSYSFMQVLELKAEVSSAFAAEFGTGLASTLEAGRHWRSQRALLRGHLLTAAEAVRSGKDAHAALVDAGMEAVWKRREARAAVQIFNLHTGDVCEFRRRHGFAVPRPATLQ